MVTKLKRQPTNQDLAIREMELIAILANIPTTLGGGNHGHLGIIVEPARHLLIRGGGVFVNPANPGIYYPAKESVWECETFQSRDKRHHTHWNLQIPEANTDQLWNCGGAVDFVDIKRSPSTLLRSSWESNSRTYACRNHIRLEQTLWLVIILPKSFLIIRCSHPRMRTKASRSEAKHQDIHVGGVCKREQAEQTYGKEL